MAVVDIPLLSDERTGDIEVIPDPITVLEPHVRASRYDRLVKPAVDIALAALALAVLLPLFLVVALSIRLTLGPGVFYVQDRVGRGGRRFRMYKFRTMRHDRRRECTGKYGGADRRVCHKRADDPRHTALGRFLRRCSLDELPQLLNVVRGEMSLVGPRPELVPVVERYQRWQHARHVVKPGLTGLWQITARDRLASEGVALDLEYVQHESFRTDCRIIARTIPALFRGPGR